MLRECFVRKFLTLMLGLSLFYSTVSLATSCRGIENEYFVLCINGECTQGVESIKLPVSPYCSRQPEVAEGPIWSLTLANRVLALKSESPRDGIYRFVDRPYYHRAGNRISSFEEFNEVKRIRERFSRYIEKAADEEMSFSDLIFTLDEESPDWFALYKEKASVSELNQIREDLISDARSNRVKRIVFWSIYWSCLILLLVAFVWSINSFYSRLHHRGDKPLLTSVKAPLVTQVVLFVLVFLLAIPGLGMADRFLPFLAILPAIFFVLVAEIYQLIRLKLASNVRH